MHFEIGWLSQIQPFYILQALLQPSPFFNGKPSSHYSFGYSVLPFPQKLIVWGWEGVGEG